MATIGIVKQLPEGQKIALLFGPMPAPAPRIRCADCGFLEEPTQMWFVPTGKHRLFGDTRAICRECLDTRLTESTTT